MPTERNGFLHAQECTKLKDAIQEGLETGSARGVDKCLPSAGAACTRLRPVFPFRQ
jgi:hypothetical protein